MKAAKNNLPSTNFSAGDRVEATDGAGIKHSGYLHHRNGCGQFYVMPDSNRQPFYAFPSEIVSLGLRQPGFVERPILSEIDRQRAYVAHMASLAV